jgi:hypothetical protein
MTNCDYCKKKINGLPHTCRYCGKIHCPDHLLPENHDCKGLKEYSSKNSERWKKNVSEIVSQKSQKSNEDFNYIPRDDKRKQIINKKSKHSEGMKYSFSDKFNDIKKWLIKRGHREYDFNRRKNYLVKIILIFCLSILGIFFFYSRADQFNQVNLWIFNLGGLLILTSIFFALKYGSRLMNESHNFLKRRRKWIKIILFLILLILIWQIFSNEQIISEKIKNIYSQTEFSLLTPFSLSKSSGFSGQEVQLPSFFIKNSCSEIEEHAKNQYLNSAKYKKNFCGAICSEQNLEYQRYSCDKEDKFHCYCKKIENE